MRLKAVLLMMLLVRNLFAVDSTPAPEPDFKALYLKTNEAARQWKEEAEFQTKRADAFKAQLADLQKRFDAASVAMEQMKKERMEAQAKATSNVPTRSQSQVKPKKFEMIIPEKQWVLPSKEYNGPNEWIRVSNVQQSFVEISVGYNSPPRRFELKTGIEGTDENKTFIMENAGISLLFVHTIRRKSGQCIFEVVDNTGF